MNKTHLIFTLRGRRSFTRVRETGAREGERKRGRVSFLFFASRGRECLHRNERDRSEGGNES
jgi:hypothetical protein